MGTHEQWQDVPGFEQVILQHGMIEQLDQSLLHHQTGHQIVLLHRAEVKPHVSGRILVLGIRVIAVVPLDKRHLDGS